MPKIEKMGQCFTEISKKIKVAPVYEPCAMCIHGVTSGKNFVQIDHHLTEL